MRRLVVTCSAIAVLGSFTAIGYLNVGASPSHDYTPPTFDPSAALTPGPTAGTCRPYG